MGDATYAGRRITDEEVEAAYLETGIDPQAGRYLAPKSYAIEQACGIGVLVCKAKGIRRGERLAAPVTISALLGISKPYLHAFTSGFDGAPYAPRTTPESRIGYEDGKAARIRVFGGSR